MNTVKAAKATEARHTTFSEVMAGTLRLTGETTDRPIRLELIADLPGVFNPLGDVEGRLSGRALVGGTTGGPGTRAAGEPDAEPAAGPDAGNWAADSEATGTLRVAPIAARRIRYRLDFTAADGRRLRLDGWKSIEPRRPLRSMTTLPATITDPDGMVVGTARLRFHLRDLPGFLVGFRFPRRPPGPGDTALSAPSSPCLPSLPSSPSAPSAPSASDGPEGEVRQALRSRWRGQPHRLEVWYTTLTDPATGTGLWLHHELVAPSGGGPATAHGWATVFPPGEPPVFGRFGPTGWSAPEEGFAADDVLQTAGRFSGTAGPIRWELTSSGGGRPLYTFPRWAWQRELLPAAQMLPEPTARFDGTVRFGDRELRLSGAPGGNARIYGHGNARRWVWLHADLGDGDVCEVVAAVSTRPGLRRLPALPFVRLRVGGREWPAGDPLRAAFRLRASIGLPTWTVRGRLGDRLIEITVTQRPAETVSVDYADPDGAPAVCHNSERADAVITLYRRRRRSGPGGHDTNEPANGPANESANASTPGRRNGWEPEREWRLDGIAHAEVGLR